MKKITLLLSLLCLACLLLAAPAAAAGGDGTSANPYQIETAAELQSIQNDLSSAYILMADIDLTDITWSPIGSLSTPFFGSFDGNGKTISNLTISSTTSHTGFFSSITSGATIKDVTFQDCSVTSTSNWCGVVIGSIIMSSSAHETAAISNVDCVRCSASTSSYMVGCLVGVISTSAVVEITGCDVSYSEVESTGSDAVGCLVGRCIGSSSTEITRCNVLYSHARASVHIASCFVGACTGASSLVIEQSTAQNSIAESSNGHYVGCLMGECDDSSSVAALNCDVLNCLAKGINYVGGLYGINWDGSVEASDCTVTGCTIVAANYAGGVAGRVASGQLGIFSGCTVTDSTILATLAAAAGICPAYS